MLGNVGGGRQVFERWMRFEPDHAGWMAYIRFELRYNEVERARAIFQRYCEVCDCKYALYCSLYDVGCSMYAHCTGACITQ